MVNINNLNPQFITDNNGVKKSVILSIDEFQELIEDIQDLAALAERRDEAAISHEEVIAELKKDGLL